MENPEMDALVEEMLRRQAIDGIPRYITKDNVIMKMDWELSPEIVDQMIDNGLNVEQMEAHIQKLMEEADGDQGCRKMGYDWR